MFTVSGELFKKESVNEEREDENNSAQNFLNYNAMSSPVCKYSIKGKKRFNLQYIAYL